jgi:hypothetical protein
MKGFLYQTISADKRARRQKDRKRESVRGSARVEMGDSIGNKIDH